MNKVRKTIVITGASSGLGEAAARLLADQGHNVVLGARREEKLKRIVNEIKEAGGYAEAFQMDVTVKDQVYGLVQKAIQTFGSLDVMINNAGLMAIAPLKELKVDEWEKMIDINIKGVLYGIAAALPVFQQQKRGHFINISSVAGIKVFSPGGTVYSGTKFAVKAITEGLRTEVGGDIRTTTILPGAVDTELPDGSSDETSRNYVKDFYKIAIPSESVARAILFAIEQPEDVDINEIVLRPTAQDF